MKYKLLIISFLYALLFSGGVTYAQIPNKLESLVMPGPLAMDHAKYEEDCSNCHSPFDQAKQDTLCIDCHKNVGVDIKMATGFHGRNPLIPLSECSSCHTDHEGRDFDIVGLISEIFDHRLTDFPLIGNHAITACAQCHTEGQKFHEAKTGCISCHQEDDSHKGSMGEDCSSCHTANLWMDVKFDHGQTKFPLKGGHADVTCSNCHPDTRYTETPVDCVSCHVNNDDHEGRFGTKCETCHTDQSWQPLSFDHNKYSDFSLIGKHKTISCEACHTSTSPLQDVATGCVDCHINVDVHKGQYGTDCKACHTESSWEKSDFDHDVDTKFVLNGAHKQVNCFSCHSGGQVASEITSQTCVDCHGTDDVHRGKLGQNCQDCHSETLWTKNVTFDHDFSSFPLVGLHSITACDDCHLTQEYKDTKSNCSSCHIEEDIHKNTLSEACADCHNPNGWAFWQYDHNTQSDFALDGAHDGLACIACHTTPTNGKVTKASDCVDCHRADDIHNSRFGNQCDQCHISEDFNIIRMAR